MNYTILMDLVSAIASKLAVSGAETYRVEESVRRIAAAYGLEARVYAIPHSLFITIMIPGQFPMTQLCRMDHLGTDLEAVELYSNLSRKICAETPNWETANALWGPPVNAPVLSYHPVIQCIFSVVASAGFVIIFNIHGYGNLLCALGGGITWAAFCVVQAFGGQELLCYFIATVVAAIFAEVMARVRKYPAISYLISSLLPLIPGSGIYFAAQQAVQGNSAGFVAYGTKTLAIAGVMAVGILLIVTLTKLRSSHRKSTPETS